MSDTPNTPQPAPQQGSAPATWDLVKRDFDERDATGARKYGRRHQHDNGRLHLVDLYQELLDAVVYVRAEIERRRLPTELRLSAIERREDALWLARCAWIEDHPLGIGVADPKLLPVFSAIEMLHAEVHAPQETVPQHAIVAAPCRHCSHPTRNVDHDGQPVCDDCRTAHDPELSREPTDEEMTTMAETIRGLGKKAAPDALGEKKRHGIYVASKCRHAEKWKALRADGWPIISSWLDESEPGQTSSFTDLWARNVREASGAAAVIFYVEPGETMKGSLVEIGAAMAHGVPVYGVGTPEGCTFREHPAFCECPSLDDALRSLGWVKAPPAAPDAAHYSCDGCRKCCESCANHCTLHPRLHTSGKGKCADCDATRATVAPPAAPDALGEAIELVQNLSIHNDAVLSVRAALGSIYKVLHQARAAHAEERMLLGGEPGDTFAQIVRRYVDRQLAAARAEAEGLRKELAQESGEVLALEQERDAALARAEEAEKERDALKEKHRVTRELSYEPEALANPSSVDVLVKWWRAAKAEIEARGGMPDCLFQAISEAGEAWEFDPDEIVALVDERDALRASLAAAQEREGKLREALLGTSPRISADGKPCWCDADPVPHGHGHGMCCSAARAALSAPAKEGK